jgi:ABC-2 type transport system permease protein
LVIVVWVLFLTVLMFAIGLLVGKWVVIPGWSMELVGIAFGNVIGSAALTLTLLPFVAFIASMGRCYMPPFVWTILTIFLAQIVALTGWGDWFPWSVAALFSGAAGPREALMGVHSYIIVMIASVIGLAATFYWWRSADQTR